MSVHPGIKKKKKRHGKLLETVNEQAPHTIKTTNNEKLSVPFLSGTGTLEISFNFISHLNKSAS